MALFGTGPNDRSGDRRRELYHRDLLLKVLLFLSPPFRDLLVALLLLLNMALTSSAPLLSPPARPPSRGSASAELREVVMQDVGEPGQPPSQV
eukprot:758235-Hanusia_phi.AAC.2